MTTLIHHAHELPQSIPQPLVLVPTMGGLHAGHIALVRRARALGKSVVVSIFVNPTQFAPDEDFETYPRDLKNDCAQLEGLADWVYAPPVAEIYPETQSVWIELPPASRELCGASRPHFFRGVAVVVTKLFNLLRPQVAVFGQKDYQQAWLLRHLVRQLNMNINIDIHPIVREDDGLAMSSRNAYLSAAERKHAPRLYETLSHTADAIRRGESNVTALCAQAKQKLSDCGMAVDYFTLRNANTLAPIENADENKTAPQTRILLAAAQLGKTRLIDNVFV